MNNVRLAALAAVLFGVLIVSVPAHAQLGSRGRGNESTTTTGPTRYGAVVVYPYAGFRLGGSLPNGTSGTTSNIGGLFSLDFGFRKRGHVDALEFGGWYWSDAHSNLYQVHGRYMFNPDLGFQAALLNTTRGAPNLYTLFAIYDLDSHRIGAKTRRAFGIQFGVGTLLDSGQNKTTSDLSFYANARLNLATNITLNGTAWYVRDRNVDLNRFAVGLGYSF